MVSVLKAICGLPPRAPSEQPAHLNEATKAKELCESHYGRRVRVAAGRERVNIFKRNLTARGYKMARDNLVTAAQIHIGAVNLRQKTLDRVRGYICGIDHA